MMTNQISHVIRRSAVAASLVMALGFQAPAASAAQPAQTPRDICITRLEASASSQHGVRNRYTRAANAIDGNPESAWESRRDGLPKEPQSITIELDTLCVVDALRYVGRGRGRIREYEIQVSRDGRQFTSVAAGQWDPQGPPEERVAFAPVEARQVRLIAQSAAVNVAMARQITLESPHPLLPRGEVVVPPAADAEARRAAFAARQNPEALGKLADQLSRFLRIDAPELKEFADRYGQSDINGALQAFNQAFAARLIERREPLEDMPFLNPVNPRLASLLLANIVKTSDGRFVDLGKAGSIDWENGTAFANSPHVGIFNQLLGVYELTGDRAYLGKWAGLVDDMAMHHRRDRLRPFEISNQDGQAWNLLHLLNRLMSVEKARPGSLEALPSGTLPRLLMAIIPQDIALNDTYFSSYAGNWHPENGARQVQLGLVLDDWIAMDTPLVQRGIDRLGLYGVRANLPDGTEAEPSIGYNNMFVAGALHALKWLEPTAENEVPPMRLRELLEDVIRRERWRLLVLTYERRQPLVLRQDGRQWPVERSNKVANDPLIARAMAALAPESKETLTSVFFPWGGYNIIRENWTKDGQYGSMMSRPYISPFGTRGVTDNLNLGIHAFGHDLLADGVTTQYARSESQLRVDNRGQLYHVDYGNPKEPFTAAYLTDAWEKPSTARWLHSASFDFMEGAYSGRYGSGRSEEQMITDVAHQRQVVFARDAGLWIIIDRLRAAEQPRDFTWNWMLPSSEIEENILTFKPAGKTGEIAIDTAENRIFTSKPDTANITLQTFTDAPLTFSIRNRLNARAPSGKVAIIGATAQGQRETLAVTAILPRQTLAMELTDVSRQATAEVEGFTATTPTGAIVRSQAARQGTTRLQCGDIAAEAELLITVTTDNRVSALVLGGTRLSRDGKRFDPRMADFVLTLDGTRLQQLPVFTPILAAIDPVEISPAQSVFIGQQEITLSSATPEVEIRYTLDGGEPSRSSQRYKRPLTVRDSTRIRARAFRSGRQAPEGTLDFTLDSAESSAVYERQQPLAPVADATDIQPGVRYRYVEGDWQKLYLNSELAESTATGTVSELFDLAPKKTEGPFTFIYEGYLKVPETGVYTFHAPLELIDNRLIDAGYELYLEIDGHPWRPAMRRHAFGGWSVALQEGAHRFKLKYVDYRGDLVVGYNRQGERQELPIDHGTWDKPFEYLDMIKPLDTERRACDFVWVGPPRLEISGPGFERQPLPAQWLHAMRELLKQFPQ